MGTFFREMSIEYNVTIKQYNRRGRPVDAESGETPLLIRYQMLTAL
jgi:hypothetical protein